MGSFDVRRAALIICESVRDANILYEVLPKHPELQQVLQMQHGDVIKYVVSYEAPEGLKQLKPGMIVIGTNIIGRGTDFTLNPILEMNLGIHVITQFLPSNERVVAQAFGRTARCL